MSEQEINSEKNNFTSFIKSRKKTLIYLLIFTVLLIIAFFGHDAPSITNNIPIISLIAVTTTPNDRYGYR